MYEDLYIASDRARAVSERCTRIRYKDNPDTGRRRWLLHPELKECIEQQVTGKDIRRFRIGPGPTFEKKFEMVLLFTGATGSGKSTLINSLLNYLYEVDFDDDIRLELPQREIMAGSAESVTREVLIYELYDTRIEQVLTVVDTPGFADTEGPSRDRVTIQRITEFLQYEQQWGSARIDAIVFVINSTDCRHGLQTIYEYDQVCSLFTVNMKRNIIPMFTKYDGADITALSVLQSARIHVDRYFSLNNAGFFLDPERNPCGQLAKFQESCQTFDAFFDHLSGISHQNLTELVKKLTAQQELQSATESLYKRIMFEMEKYSTLLTNVQKLKANENEVVRQREFRMLVPGQMQQVRHDHSNANARSLICIRCQQTCHLHCKHLSWKRLCPKISILNNTCKQCGCSVKEHQNVNFHYVETAIMEEVKMSGESNKKEDLIKMALRDIYKKLRQSEIQRKDLMQEILTKQKMIEELQLYRSIYNTSAAFIDDLIEHAQKTKRAGYQKNIVELRRQQRIMGLVRQIMENEVSNPIQHYREDLNEAASYLIRQMPEIADWIQEKLRESKVKAGESVDGGKQFDPRSTSVQHLRPPQLPVAVKMPGMQRSTSPQPIPETRPQPAMQAKRNSNSSTNTNDSGIATTDGSRSPLPTRPEKPSQMPAQQMSNRSHMPRPNNVSFHPNLLSNQSSRPNFYPRLPANNEFETPRTLPQFGRGNHLSSQVRPPRPPPIENMPMRTPGHFAPPTGASGGQKTTGHVRGQAALWEQRGQLVQMRQPPPNNTLQ